MSVIKPCLVLRKWCKLLPSREFRCFVRQNVLIGVTQRDSANFYSHLLEEKEVILDSIDAFFLAHIKGMFPTPDFVFDIYIDQKRKVWLMDFGVYGEETDALLFSWPELDEVKFDADGFCECEMRVVETRDGILPSDQCYFGLPKDLLDISTPEGVYIDLIRSPPPSSNISLFL